MTLTRCAHCAQELERPGGSWRHRLTGRIYCSEVVRPAFPALSRRQREVLEFIEGFIRFKKYPPTIKEICETLDLRSTSTVHSHLQSLVWKGYLEIDGGPRTLRVVRPTESVPS